MNQEQDFIKILNTDATKSRKQPFQTIHENPDFILKTRKNR